ncbi:MAG: hypothetical protein N3A60_13045, partial [Thermanaerothrix sp.]|nr:hypothetical protein [Thermanaerothrix sp.]
MNLDDLTIFNQLDRANMYDEIDRLPDQLGHAWKQGMQFPLHIKPPIRQVVIAGMGGSAIGADLFVAYGEPLLKVPVLTCREYELPAWARGPETLVIGSSHSGNTEETLAAGKQAGERGCQLVVITTGGELAALGQNAGWDVWQFEHAG